MARYLVTYDLCAPGRNYDELIKEINTFPAAKITESSWAIISQLNVKQIAARLTFHMDASDRLFVADLGGMVAWNNVLAPNEKIRAMFP
jgi:hypothetical protein